MLDWVKSALSCLSGPHTRPGELHDLHRRLSEQAGPGVTSQTERELAVRLRSLREELAAEFNEVKACRDCVRPRSLDWPGGHCCSGHTLDIFTDHELAALGLAGTTPNQLKPPHAQHIGCAFRGPRGCSLEAVHRPCLCLRYACHELESELEQAGNRRKIARLQGELQAGFEQFVQFRTERIQATLLAELEADLSRHTR
jgi:hypothetical protein